MFSYGIEAIVIKVASLGLSKEHVGIPLQHLLPHLQGLSKKWGAINYAGEGGEYETLVLDCPLYHSKLDM